MASRAGTTTTTTTTTTSTTTTTTISTIAASCSSTTAGCVAPGQLPASILQNRHIPRRIAAAARHRRSFNHVVRANAKRLAQGHEAASLCERLGLPCTAAADGLRPHLEADLRRHYTAAAVAARPPPRLRCRNNRLAAHDLDQDEGRDLALSEVPLPSDRFRLARRPALEREDAFRDATTSRGPRVRLRAPPPDAADAAQVAELYRLGLLYDDDDDADADAFNLNSIRHDQPVYSIRTAKRAHKGPRSRKAAAAAAGPDSPLHLQLSFSDLGDDTAIAQFLSSPCHAPPIPGDAAHEPQHSPGQPQQAGPPLRVIYELAGTGPMFDVETSQPPDLIFDLLSDYDCFSDSEFDDEETPSQREMHVGADGPSSDAWVVLGHDS